MSTSRTNALSVRSKHPGGRPRKPPPTMIGFRTPAQLRALGLSNPPGRPKEYDTAGILADIEKAQQADAVEGRRLSRRAALLEPMLKAQRKRNLSKHRGLVKWTNYYEAEGLPRNRALSQAFQRPEFAEEHKHLRKLERLISYEVTGRSGRK